jgi:predicted dehydrogenase
VKTKVGFLGTGMMGLGHIEIIRDRFPEAQVVAICDPYAPYLDKAKSAAPTARTCKDATEMCATDVDAVVISTPGNTHADLVDVCLKAGKHVFCEKPVMTTRDGCQRMVELAQRHDKQVLMMNHQLRYAKFFQTMKDMVARGDVGEVQLVWCREFRGPFLKKVGDWIQDSRYSGGCLVDKNSHQFDLMNWWVGARPKKVCGFGGADVVHVVNNPYEVIDHASVSFEYDNGVRGGMVISMFAPRMEDDLEMGVMGTQGAIQTRVGREEIWQWKRASQTSEPNIHKVPLKSAGHGTFEAHQAFFDAIAGRGKILTGVRDCVDGTLLAIAAEEAIRSGTIVEV